MLVATGKSRNDVDTLFVLLPPDSKEALLKVSDYNHMADVGVPNTNPKMQSWFCYFHKS